jgi:uncharacterized protein YutE (UPF0331/DUF86 family)
MRPGKCRTRIERMKSVEREYQIAIASSDALTEALRRTPSLLTEQGLVRADLDAQIENLALTYLIRLFAEFETGLRDYWAALKNKKKNIPGRGMIDSLSSTHTIDDKTRQNVHAVRKYRNSLVHEDDFQADPVSIPEARRSLCLFFGHLPYNR